MMRTSTRPVGTPASGFTMIEMVMVLTLMGVMAAIAVPFMRVSPSQRVNSAATQLVRDLELMRTRALASKKSVRMLFDPATQTYVGFMDHDKDGTIAETAEETRALKAGARRGLEMVQYGRGSAPILPGDSIDASITFAGNRVDFDTRGITTPFGTRGTVYLVHRDYPDAVAAVSISGSASFKAWRYTNGAWQ